MELKNGRKKSTLFRSLAWAIIGISLFPFFLTFIGVDFGSSKIPLDLTAASGMAPNELVDAMHHTLSGSFVHTILEWSAFCTAIFTVILAFVHFRLKGDAVVPVVAVTLFLAGFMDAFHTLAADRLIAATADNRDLIPFTWAVCRLFKALIPITGIGIILFRGVEQKEYLRFKFVIALSMAFAFIAYSAISYCATSDSLPTTMFPDAILTRPWDVGPLVLYVLSGFTVYRKFYKDRRDNFSFCIWLSVIPDIATQIYMAFGSTALFDNHFNIAHFIKIIAYLVPFLGLLMDYVQTYQDKEIALRNLLDAQDELSGQKEEVEKAFKIAELRKSELERKAEDLERTNKVMVGRELRVIELKKEIKELKTRGARVP